MAEGDDMRGKRLRMDHSASPGGAYALAEPGECLYLMGLRPCLT